MAASGYGGLGCGGDDEPAQGADASATDSGVITDASSAPTDANLGPATSTFDAGSDANRNVVSKGAICERFSTLQCAGEQACCSNPGRTFDACKAVQLDACRTQGHLDDASNVDAAGFDAALAKTAFERFEQLALRCDLGVTAWVLETNAGFRGIFAGTLDANASCLPPLNVIINQDQGAAAGWALACRNPETTACLPATLSNWTCVARGAVGAQCFTDANCTGDTFCDNPNPGISSIGGNTTCKTRKALGAACVNASECETLVCAGKQCAPKSADGVYCLGR